MRELPAQQNTLPLQEKLKRNTLTIYYDDLEALVAPRQQLSSEVDRRDDLHHAPNTANLAEGHPYLTKSFVACIPTLIDDRKGTTVPTMSAASRLAFKH